MSVSFENTENPESIDSSISDSSIIQSTGEANIQGKGESENSENSEIKNSEVENSEDPFAEEDKEENKEQPPADKVEQPPVIQYPQGNFPPVGPPGRFFQFPYPPPMGPQGKFFPFPLPGPNFPQFPPPYPLPFNPNDPNPPKMGLGGPPMPFPPGQFPYPTPFFSPFMKPGLYPGFSSNSIARNSVNGGRTPGKGRLIPATPAGTVRSALLERLCRNRECLELIPFGSNNNKRFCKKSCLYRHNNLKKEHMRSSGDRTLLALRNRLETYVEQAEAEHKPEQEIKNEFEKLRAELKDAADKHMNN